MLKKRLSVARNVVDHLAEAERVNDLALVATAKLVISMLEGRLALNTAAVVGQHAFEAVASTFERQSASRGQLVVAHAALSDAQTLIGLDGWDLGGGGDKKVPTSNGHLTVVDREAA